MPPGSRRNWSFVGFPFVFYSDAPTFLALDLRTCPATSTNSATGQSRRASGTFDFFREPTELVEVAGRISERGRTDRQMEQQLAERGASKRFEAE